MLWNYALDVSELQSSMMMRRTTHLAGWHRCHTHTHSQWHWRRWWKVIRHWKATYTTKSWYCNDISMALLW